MKLFDLVPDDPELSNEGIMDTIKKRDKMGEAYKAEAKNASHDSAIDKKTSEEIEREFEEKEDKYEQKKEIKKANRKEAMKDLGEGLIEAAKATGRGVKETARIAYNLARGTNH